jgi:hypothetical protein
MRLLRTAVKFDKTPCCDAYTGSFSFNGQLKTWPESLRDSEVAVRRVLSTGPSVVLPARRAIKVFGDVFILGTGDLDTHRGAPIRRGYTAAQVDGLATVQSLSQLLTATPGFNAYSGKSWVKNEAEVHQDSKLNSQYQVFFSSTETIPVASIVTLNGVMLLTRNAFVSPSGLQIVVCDELQAPNLEGATLSTSTWNPATNQAVKTDSSVGILRIRWQSLFAYAHAAAPVFEPGDIQLAMVKSAGTPTTGSVFALSDGHWTVKSVTDFNGCWICRVGRAG